MIEFERELVGRERDQAGGATTRPYTVTISEITDLQPDPLNPERTVLYIRNRGEMIANASYGRMRNLIRLVRDQMDSLIEGDA
jgi:hypothetical protein